MTNKPNFNWQGTKDLLKHRQKEDENKLVHSYLGLRNLIGICGIALPFMLLAGTLREGGWAATQQSISCCFYTKHGDLLVGVLCLLAGFLFAYKGYNWIDNLVSKLASICAVGIAFNPTTRKIPMSDLTIHSPEVHITPFPVFGELHLFFAVSFFVLLAVMALCLFTKSDKTAQELKGTQKAKRNLVYKICGWVIVACILVLLLFFKVDAFAQLFGNFKLTFCLETVALVAFGTAWLTKGETLWPDVKHNYKKHLKHFLNIE